MINQEPSRCLFADNLLIIVPLRALPKEGEVSSRSILRISCKLCLSNEEYMGKLRAKEEELEESRKR